MITDASSIAIRLTIIAGLVLLLATIPGTAHAYIDPVTGSLIIQGLIAGVAAVMAGVRSIRERIISLFTRKSPKPRDTEMR